MKLDWGKGIFIFFVIFLGLATIFMVFSFRQRNDLVTEDYYEKGADFTSQMKINARSAEFSDSLWINHSKRVTKILFAPTLAQQVDSLHVHFYYPADKKRDLHLKHKTLADDQMVSTGGLSSGRYIAKIRWMMNGEQYYLEKTIFID